MTKAKPPENSTAAAVAAAVAAPAPAGDAWSGSTAQPPAAAPIAPPAPAPAPAPVAPAGALRTDGPTLAEYVAAGYLAEKYPPHGYAAREETVNVKTLPPGELIRMYRSKEVAPAGPWEADVHPDELGSFALGGWSTRKPE